MRTLTILCNVVVFGLTCLVTATEGAPKELAYIVFTLLLVLVPIVNVFALIRSRPGGSTQMARVAAVCNVLLLGFVCWALIDQYPPPEGMSAVVFAAFIALTLVLSLVVLLRVRQGQRPVSPPAGA